MVLPLLAPVLVGGSALSGIYHVGKAQDNAKFWSNYQRNTGFAPRYPWRSGRYDYIGEYGRTLTSFGVAGGLAYSPFANMYRPSMRTYNDRMYR